NSRLGDTSARCAAARKILLSAGFVRSRVALSRRDDTSGNLAPGPARGPAGGGAVFGPITLLLFIAISLLGIQQIIRAPQVLAAINPIYGFEFFMINGSRGYLVLGAVFLVVTGGEALYADIGHFGTAPIRLTWFAI